MAVVQQFVICINRRDMLTPNIRKMVGKWHPQIAISAKVRNFAPLLS